MADKKYVIYEKTKLKKKVVVGKVQSETKRKKFGASREMMVVRW